MSLEFPWAAYAEAQRRQDQNRKDMNQNIAGLGQSLGQDFNTIGQQIQEAKKKEILQQIVTAMQGQGAPEQGPQMPGPFGPPVGAAGPSGPGAGIPGYVPPNQGPNSTAIPTGQPTIGMNPNPMSGMGAPPADNTKLINSLMMQYSPETAMNRIPTPLQQSEITKNNAQAFKYQAGGGMKPTGTVYRNSATGEMTDDPNAAVGPEWKAYKTSQGDVLNKLSAQSIGDKKTEAKGQADLKKEWDDITKTINPFRPTGFGASTSIFAKAANANRAAASGVKLLRKPSLTWGEFNAYVNSDFANLQRGGTPTDIQLSEANYKTLMGKVGGLIQYVTGKPATGLIPPKTRAQMEENFHELIDIDNNIIDDAVDYVQVAHPDAIAAFPTRWNNVKQAASKIKTLVEFSKKTGEGVLSPAEQAEFKALEAKFGGKL